MAIILGILIAIILYFRIKKILRIFFSFRFWIGLVLNAVFFYGVYTYFSSIKETLKYYIHTYIDSLNFEQEEFIAMIGVGALCFFIWIFLCRRSRAFVTPFIFVLSVATLGLVIFNASDGFDSAIDDDFDSSDSTSNQTWVDPHEVSGYERGDGTQVSGYIRDGEGEGYLRRY
jgi:hypothetical protein